MKKLLKPLLDDIIWVLKKTEYVIIVFLIGLMTWFVNGVWFSDNYAPPTRSVFWVGCILGIILWSIYSHRTEWYSRPRGSKANSKSYKFGMAMAILSLNFLYVLVPTYARYYVNEQGRYWRTSSVFSNDVGEYTLDFSANSAWPRWTFLEKATDPFSLPTSLMSCPTDSRGKHTADFCWTKSITKQDFDVVPGFRCDITIEYSYTAMESLTNIFALREYPVTVADVDSLMWLQLGDRIITAASSGIGSCKLDTETEVFISGGFDPWQTLNARLRFSSKELKCSYRLVQLI